MQVGDALDGGGLGAIGGDEESGDLVLFHEVQGFRSDQAGSDGVRVGMEDGKGGLLEGAGAEALKEPAEVPVGDDTEEFAPLLHGGDAETFGAHFMDDGGHGSVGRNTGDSRAGVHEVADRGEPAAERAAGVEGCKGMWSEAEALAEGDGEGVAQGKHGRGGRGGRELVGTGFAVDGNVEGVEAVASQCGCGAAGEGEEPDAESMEGREKAEQLLGFAGVAQGEKDVARAEQAKIAVQGLSRVQKGGRNRHGGERGGDFSGDETTLAHAGEDEVVTAAENPFEQIEGGVEDGPLDVLETLGEGCKRGSFDADEIGGGDSRLCVVVHPKRMLAEGWCLRR